MSLEYAATTAADDAIVLKVVADEQEAEIACGFLRSAGRGCGYRETEAFDAPLKAFIGSGPREILVHMVPILSRAANPRRGRARYMNDGGQRAARVR